MYREIVLDDFSSNNVMAIVPKQILLELDGLKESDEFDESHKARQAINKIREYSNANWLNLNEDNYLELLSESYKETDRKYLFILSLMGNIRINL